MILSMLMVFIPLTRVSRWQFGTVVDRTTAQHARIVIDVIKNSNTDAAVGIFGAHQAFRLFTRHLDFSWSYFQPVKSMMTRAGDDPDT
jgi:hypothetical protein